MIGKKPIIIMQKLNISLNQAQKYQLNKYSENNFLLLAIFLAKQEYYNKF